MTITKSSTRRLGAVLAAAGLAVSLAACGAGAKQAGVADIGTTTTTAAAPAATGGTPSSPGQAAAEIEKFASCMRAHGVPNFPGPKVSANTIRLVLPASVTWPVPPSMNTNSPQFLPAREICEMLIPEGLPYSKEAEGGK